MGRYQQQNYTDTETDNTSSSVEALKKKKKTSTFRRILKYTTPSIRNRKKCKIHSRSEIDDSDHSKDPRKKIPKGILKYSSNRDYRNQNYYNSSTEEEEEDDRGEYYSPSLALPASKFLVGQVPPPAGRPGRGGGLALLVRRTIRAPDINRYAQPKQSSSTSKKNSHYVNQLSRKRSY